MYRLQERSHSRFHSNIKHGGLRYLDLSHCKVADLLSSKLPSKCPLLKILLLQDCQDITERAYITSHFKVHGSLKVVNVAHSREALSMQCLIELLKYTNGKVLIDISLHKKTLIKLLRNTQMLWQEFKIYLLISRYHIFGAK